MPDYPTIDEVRADLALLTQREGLQYARVARAGALQRLLAVENELRVSHHSDRVAVTYDVVRCALSEQSGLGATHRSLLEVLLNIDQDGPSTLDDRRRVLESQTDVGETTRARREDLAFQELARVLLSMRYSPCNPYWEEQADRRRQKRVRDSFANRHSDALQAFRFGLSRLREDVDEEQAMADAHELLELLRKPAAIFRSELPDQPVKDPSRLPASAGPEPLVRDDPRRDVWYLLTRVARGEYEAWIRAIPSKPVLLGPELFLHYLWSVGSPAFLSDDDAKKALVDKIGVLRTYGDLGMPYPGADRAFVKDADVALDQAVAGSFEVLARIVASYGRHAPRKLPSSD